MDGARPDEGTPLTPLPETQGRATLALVLGVLSMFCTGFVTGVPAIVLGTSVRRQIAESGGRARGGELALAAVLMGGVGSVMSLVSAGILLVTFGAFGHVALLGHGRQLLPPPSAEAEEGELRRAAPPGPTGASNNEPAPRAHRVAAARTLGVLRLVDADPADTRTLRRQLTDELTHAAAKHEVVLAMTTNANCTPCDEIESTLADTRVQTALGKATIVLVDSDAFEADLRTLGMYEDTSPWFYKLDARARPVDAVSGGEWDENVPENVAPVLGAFMRGTLGTRKTPSTTLGTPL